MPQGFLGKKGCVITTRSSAMVCKENSQNGDTVPSPENLADSLQEYPLEGTKEIPDQDSDEEQRDQERKVRLAV